MAIKVYKKNNAGRRNMSIVKPDNLTDKKPEKSLVVGLSNKSGRSNGKISVRHKGGRVKRQYRLVDFKQNKFGISGRIEAIEKDPNRSALIALVFYKDGEKRYILATEGMKKDDQVLTQEDAPVKSGNRLALKNIPAGTTISCLELMPGKGIQIIRSAGGSASLMSIDGDKAQVKMASGEIRLFNKECFATIGQVSNFEHSAIRIGKAGRRRKMGFRPAVRGSAMNPVDHPHGGGEGRQGVGLKYPKTPWGKCALGKKTRRKNRYSNNFIVSRRKK
ncbi:MAG: 50S ribosomal protein L2 [Candidatus Moranbacteria bacterium]|nr:50S ribosomal protein L2 [Candidatus Moranbacteria bacterium]